MKCIWHYANRGFGSGKYERPFFFFCNGTLFSLAEFSDIRKNLSPKLCKFLPYCTTSHIKEKVLFLCIDTSMRDRFLSRSSAVFCSNVLDHYVSRNFSLGRTEAWLVGWLVGLIYFLEIMLVSSAASRKTHFSFTFIVSPCIFVHLVFHQLMHSYILLKYYHRQLL